MTGHVPMYLFLFSPNTYENDAAYPNRELHYTLDELRLVCISSYSVESSKLNEFSDNT